jgi:hypothetical protein
VCFGTTQWPNDIPVPQASIELEVPDVGAAAEKTHGRGYQLLHRVRTEPWGQITARLLSPEGLLVAVCYSPSFHTKGPLEHPCQSTVRSMRDAGAASSLRVSPAESQEYS